MLENTDFLMSAFVLGFIVLDYATGLIKAVVNQNISSTKMREGLFHKLAFVLALLLGYACQVATCVFALPDAFAAIFPAVALWIVITEVASIYENLLAINPELGQSPLAQLIDDSEKPNEE